MKIKMIQLFLCLVLCFIFKAPQKVLASTAEISGQICPVKENSCQDLKNNTYVLKVEDSAKINLNIDFNRNDTSNLEIMIRTPYEAEINSGPNQPLVWDLTPKPAQPYVFSTYNTFEITQMFPADSSVSNLKISFTISVPEPPNLNPAYRNMSVSVAGLEGNVSKILSLYEAPINIDAKSLSQEQQKDNQKNNIWSIYYLVITIFGIYLVYFTLRKHTLHQPNDTILKYAIVGFIRSAAISIAFEIIGLIPYEIINSKHGSEGWEIVPFLIIVIPLTLLIYLVMVYKHRNKRVAPKNS